MTSQKIPAPLLQHLEYLRSLSLPSPVLKNVYLSDEALQQYTAPYLSSKPKFLSELKRLGERFATIYMQAAKDAEQNPPRLEQFNAYGQRTDRLILSEGWKKQSILAAQDGIVSLAYEKDQWDLGQLKRFGQLMVLYMYQPSSGLFGCPLAMSDGAAYTISLLLKKPNVNSSLNASYLEKAYNHLTSRTDAWTSGQWMTEKKGGSDVSRTETIAIKDPKQNFYRLYGYKWFTSATDSQMTLALGKIVTMEQVQRGVEELAKVKVSMFYVELRNSEGKLDHIEIIRLKDKLGTRQLPTAELLLKGVKAHLISEEGQGVKAISKMLLLTRMYNSSTAVGLMRRGLLLAKDYAEKRTIGKQKLSKLPLQLRVISNLEVISRGSLIFFVKMSHFLSKQQAGTITPHEANLLRVLSPLLKLYTGKEAVAALSEIIEGFGGMGYIEGSGLPVLLRDAQVLTIWQGTTNVLSYDFLRALTKKQNEFLPLESLTNYFLKSFEHAKGNNLEDKDLLSSIEKILTSYNIIIGQLSSALKINFKGHHSELRTYAFGLSRLFIAVELLNHAIFTYKKFDMEVLRRWVDRGIFMKENYSSQSDQQLAINMKASL